MVIPRANVRHLMLRRDVIEAAAAGKFHIYAVATVDEAIAVLTGLPPSERDAAGNFPEGSFNQKVEARLIELTERAKKYMLPQLGALRTEAGGGETQGGGGNGP